MASPTVVDLADFEIWKEESQFIVYESLTGKHMTFDSLAQVLAFIEAELQEAIKENER